MSEVYTQLMEVRRLIPKRERDLVVACVSYACEQCGVVAIFDVCQGVHDPSVDYEWPCYTGVPAPGKIKCRMCDGSMRQDKRFSTIPARAPSVFPRLRVPSRRAAVKLAREGSFQAQVVETEGP